MTPNNICDVFRIYGVFGTIRLLVDILQSKLLFRNIRIIRRPYYIRGRKFIKIGENFTSGVGLRLDGFSRNKQVCITIGNNVQVNDYVHIGAVDSVTIKNNVLIGSKVLITDHDHGFYGLNGRHTNPNIEPSKRELASSPVTIEENVWIGEFVCILPGATIGKGSVIGAMSVVRGHIPEYSIAVGCPAVVKKRFNYESAKWETVKRKPL